MKKITGIIGSLCLLLLLHINSQAEEITLYNSEGEPVAYIDTDDQDLPIFLWNGTAVAYLSTEDDGFDIYGYNGKHLGWYEEGLVYNHKGYIVGFKEGAMDIYTGFEGIKSIKDITPIKDFKEHAPFKPIYHDRFSNQSFALFLRRGKD
ncbi:hypothetical protein K4L44_07250 [Halosquirtibacter laminarini]|uniref:Uncharacterized protein n=1 Tax=Halosquirtibacter laminarini TaxID=3374600 RepID=A0AC61NPM9_9BACT|nr:hypothetical protein K4L44_07250 [Prolixibacteraceae bacterium]